MKYMTVDELGCAHALIKLLNSEMEASRLYLDVDVRLLDAEGQFVGRIARVDDEYYGYILED